MTATEIIARKEEFIREIGPVFGRLETDYTAPLVERSFNIMLRAGALAPIPESLQGRGVRFEYQSPIKKLRQQVEAAAAKAWAEDLMLLSQVKPEVLDVMNGDAYAQFTAEAAELPHQLVNGMEEIQKIRQQRMEAEQAAMQAEAMRAGVDTVSAAANIPGMKDMLEAAGNA